MSITFRSQPGRTALRLPSPTAAVATAAIFLAVAGAGVAGYLAAQNLQGEAGMCTITHGCATVQKSRYGEILGVPVSVPGLGLYLLLAVAGALRLADPRGHGHLVTGAAFVGAFGGLVFSAYLTAIEAFVLDAWCIYCIASASIMSALFLLWSALLALDRRRLRRPAG